MKELDLVFKELMDDSYYKNKIKEAMAEKIVEALKYNYSDVIKEYVKEIFNSEIGADIKKLMDQSKDKLKENIEASIKDSFAMLSSSIKFKASSWDIDKFIKSNLQVELPKE